MQKEDLTFHLARVRSIHNKAAAGQTFKDLADQLKKLQSTLPRRRREPVSLPHLIEGGRNTLTQLQYLLRTDQLTEISDTQLELILTQLANEDPFIRFDKATMLFNDALANNILTKDQLHHSFNYLKRPEALLDHIEEPVNKAAVRRVASVTGLASLLYADRAGAFFITDDEVNALIDLVVVGLLWEHDNRGFVNRLGWVQLFGEYTILFGELCRRSKLVRGQKVLLMATYLVAYQQLNTPLIMGEADEGADFLIGMMNQHPVYRRYFMVFLRDWQERLQNKHPRDEHSWHKVFNYRRLMQSLLMSADLPEIAARQITNQPNENEQ